MGDWRRTKYEEIYDNYLKNGLKFKKYCEINNLNYHNTQTGIYHFRKKKELDNNASERKVKMFVIGRNNWLFYNTIKGAEVSCNLYSL